MNNHLTANPIARSWDSPITEIVEPIEFVIFNIETIWFGIALARVDRIVDITNTRNDFSLLENVEPLDLHQRLFGQSTLAPAAWTIFRAPGDRTYGIPVDTLPTLVSVVGDRLRLLPSDLRAATPLGIASHVMQVAAPADGELTVFILEDLGSDRLI